LLTKAQLIDYLYNNEIQVFLTMGAGDIDMLLPSIKEILEKKV
jgi:hypothetical protein